MTTEVLPGAAGAEPLTAALRKAGALGKGRVAAVTVESARDTILSRIIRLRLVYDGAASGAPASLILKMDRPDRAELNAGGRREVDFYRGITPASPAGLVPRCFEAAWDDTTKAWHLLLEDFSDSHVVAEAWPLPPSLERLRAIIAARARFHAAWWDDPRLGVAIGTWADAAQIAEHQRRFATQYARFSDFLGDRLPRERRNLFERYMAAAPRLASRYASRRDMTIVHGDAHVWNCLLPRDGGDDIRLFDWDSWRADTASDDLAYMMALHWYPDYRREAERPLLDHYHAALLAHGVRGYDRAALDNDYSLSVLSQITIPVWQHAYGIPPVIWWNNLERTMLAVDDLGCRELLG